MGTLLLYAVTVCVILLVALTWKKLLSSLRWLAGRIRNQFTAELDIAEVMTAVDRELGTNVAERYRRDRQQDWPVPPTPAGAQQYRHSIVSSGQVSSAGAGRVSSAYMVDDMEDRTEIRNAMRRSVREFADDMMRIAEDSVINDTDMVHVNITNVSPRYDADILVAMEEDIMQRLFAVRSIQPHRIIFNYPASWGPNPSEPVTRRINEISEVATRDMRARELLVRLIGEEDTARIEAGNGYQITSSINDKFTYEIFKTIFVRLYEQHEILGVKTRPLEWHLCIAPQDTSLQWADKVYTLITMIRADEREFVRTANFRSVGTEDEYAERPENAPGASMADMEEILSRIQERAAEAARIPGITYEAIQRTDAQVRRAEIQESIEREYDTPAILPPDGRSA